MFDHLPRLQSIDLSQSQFSGSKIPLSLFKCKDLQHIVLRDDQFVGTVPSEVGNLTSIMVFYIGGNNFVGKLKELEK